MTEPSRGLFYLPIIYLWTGGVEGDVLASLAPPVHLSGERLGWTLLVCVVSDLRRGHLEVSWMSSSQGHLPGAPYSIARDRQDGSRSAVATITVATSDWPSYSCFVSHRQHPRVIRTHHATFSDDDDDNICYDDDVREDVGWWTDEVTLLAMRLLLLKSLIFNTLMTTYVVIK
ncbi:uncharacterized protein LOC144539584 [Centroberyx gerrardi]